MAKSPLVYSEEKADEGPPFEFKTMNPNAQLRPELKEKIEKWILSFYHLDPRYKILTFFNLVASEGADNVTDDSVQDANSYVSMGSSGKSASISALPTSSPSSVTNGALNRSVSVSGTSPLGGRKVPQREQFKINANLLSRQSARNIRPSTLSLLSSLFNATSILTVWRPCSNDAMRKMMEGTGVGKGLDIKGKSAKKGSLSAFVPFMQIFNNDHKYEIQPLPESAEMRVYYKDIKLRDHVYEYLQKYKENGPPKKRKTNLNESASSLIKPIETSVVGTVGAEEMVDEAIIADERDASGNDSIRKLMESSANLSLSENWEDDDRLPPHKDPNSPEYLPETTKLKKAPKKFAKSGFYGIECSQRLFWYATIQDADISRVGTGTETGRPSLPGFQDANHKTLKVAQATLPKPSPMPCVLQYKTLEEINKEVEAKKDEAKEENDDNSDGSHPLDGIFDPRYLVMAYEEQGTIKPVVSDFDGFLLGWRREALWFGCNLPRDQEKLMMWCVDQIEKILDDQKKNPTNSDTWTIRWLDVLKKAAAEGFHIDMPEYGFGDPKSTSIMEHAAMKLKSTGAVRHGSECFNYQFPQEIDDMFLLISDTLKPVPWKYVNVKDLQAILSKKIAEGFVFPLNPKWILCDPGWKKIYDDLMASDALYADLSKDVWFPTHNGIRNRIEEIHKRHPNGFQRCTDKRIQQGKSLTKSSGRRQSASNIVRDTLNEGVGEELTGNAFADLAQLELDDFVGRTSHFSSRKTGMVGNINQAIEEMDEEDHSSTVDDKSPWLAPSKSSGKQEKRPSHVSHSSAGSVGSILSSGPKSGRSLGIDEGNKNTSNHSTTSSASKPRPGRRLQRAIQSTRKLLPSNKKKLSRPKASFMSSFGSVPSCIGEDEPQNVTPVGHTASAPQLPSHIQRPGTDKNRAISEPTHAAPRAYASRPQRTSDPSAMDNASVDSMDSCDSTGMSSLDPKAKMESSRDMNKGPRRNFTKHFALRKQVKNPKT